MSDKVLKKSNSNPQDEHKTDAVITQEEFDTAVRLDVLKKQETHKGESRTEINDKDICIQIDYGGVKPCLGLEKVNVIGSKQTQVEEVAHVSTLRSGKVNRPKSYVPTNLFASKPPPRDNIFSNLKKPLWQQNLPSPPPQTWANWIKRRRGPLVPPGYPGPLNYNPQTKNTFVRYVLYITLVMFVSTIVLLAHVWNTPSDVKSFQDASILLIIPAVIGIAIINFVLICIPCTRELPCNFLLLAATVLLITAMAGKIMIRQNSLIPIYSFLATGMVAVVNIVLSFSKYDFSSWTLFVIAMFAGILAVGAICVFIMPLSATVIETKTVLIMVTATLILVMLLTVQLQMVLADKPVQLGEEDYTMAAFMLYASMIEFFINLCFPSDD